MIKITKDKRDKTWALLEQKIQSNSLHKDKKIVLKGKWKKFVRKQDGFKIFLVDAQWIRNNLCCYFGHGGHGFVHEFISLDEIWISSHHNNEEVNELFNCPCKTKTKGQKVSKNYFNSTVIHEITEYKEMKKGKTYWESHQIALEKERQVGLLPHPFEDV